MADRYDCIILDCGNSSAENLEGIAKEDNVILVNGHGSNAKDQQELVTAMRGLGFPEVYAITPDAEELAVYLSAA